MKTKLQNGENFSYEFCRLLIPKKLGLILLYFLIFLFIIAFNFLDTPPTPSGWYQQFMPNLNGRQVEDVFFLDSLTGWAVTNATNQNNDTMYVLKTSNAGDNWVIEYRSLLSGGGYPGYLKIYFLNQSTGYTCSVQGYSKSTNGGSSWSLQNWSDVFEDMSVHNVDTQWIVSSEPFAGGVYRTTNGGANWQQQLSLGSLNPDHIYMYNARIGFISDTHSGNGDYIRKTTDGGQSWSVIVNGDGFGDMAFVDSLTGWKCLDEIDSIKNTSDGGVNWVKQTLPLEGVSGGNCLFYSRMKELEVINRDTIWGVGGVFSCTGYNFRGIIYRTTNGGNNWLYQLPDTHTVTCPGYNFITFVNKNIGWVYDGYTGAHTLTGGDSIWLTGVQKISSNIPAEFILFQNYPNPFNPKTNIKYQLANSKYVKIIVYDILGREIITLVNQKQSTGTYEVDFPGNAFSSGIYFYSLFLDNKLIDTKKMILLK